MSKYYSGKEMGRTLQLAEETAYVNAYWWQSRLARTVGEGEGHTRKEMRDKKRPDLKKNFKVRS